MKSIFSKYALDIIMTPNPSKFFSQITLYFLRGDIYFLRLYVRNLLSGNNPARIKSSASFLNIGCGAKGIKSSDWFNLDGWPEENVDFCTNLSRTLPFPESRFSGIFCEHFFEHLTPHDARNFLKECLRILTPGGTLRISVPDGSLYLKHYLSDPDWLLQQRGGVFRTPMEVINCVFRQTYEHQYCYDEETLILHLKEAGFESAEPKKFGEGEIPDLLIDQKDRACESLYAEAKKSSVAPDSD